MKLHVFWLIQPFSLLHSIIFAEPQTNIVQSPFSHKFTYFCCLNDYKIPTNYLPHPSFQWMLRGPWLCSALGGDAWRRKKREQIWFVIFMVEE
jgi:hypothetical protein